MRIQSGLCVRRLRCRCVWLPLWHPCRSLTIPSWQSTPKRRGTRGCHPQARDPACVHLEPGAVVKLLGEEEEEEGSLRWQQANYPEDHPKYGLNNDQVLQTWHEGRWVEVGDEWPGVIGEIVSGSYSEEDFMACTCHCQDATHDSWGAQGIHGQQCTLSRLLFIRCIAWVEDQIEF